MHDLLHDMGREIFRQEVPNNPAKFNPMKVFILSLLDNQLIRMEEPFKQFSYLTVLSFSDNESITTMPDVSKVENLRLLRLGSCKNLTTLHESIGFLKHLVHLSVSGCRKLEIFLQRMFLPSLEVLDLDSCEKLEHFPDIVEEMNTPLKIHMMSTSIKKLPNSVGKLIGLVSLDMRLCHKLAYLPSSLFRLPNVVAFNFGECSKLGKSFRRFLPDSPSEDNEHSTLKIMRFVNSGLSDEDMQAILLCFPKLEELNVSYNYKLVSLPTCIKESNHLKKLNVSGCSNLSHISELPCTIQNVDARKCLNFSLETSDKLWDQVKKERYGLKILMPKTKVPEWFDYICKGGIPCLWVRGKFPNVALASLFLEEQKFHYPVEFHLVINGQSVPRNSHKGYDDFLIDVDHVLVCDLRLLYNDEEWLSIDALLLKHEWNQVQISYDFKDIPVTLSEWGVYVYKQGTTDNLEDHVQFMCPDPTR
ncbi:TMV resistance protein N [Trifolium repens]|nr:TMV resistance protein N [Trifolium repens]